MIETLEQANATEDPARREELLTYVFVGGGYSGLEALAELQDFAADAMDRYPRARLHGMRWILVEAMDRVLPEVPADLADYALRELRGRGIDVRLGTRLEEVERRLGRCSRPASGSRPGPWSGPPASSRTRASPRSSCRSTTTGGSEVDEHMRVEGMHGVWAIGDCAAVPDPGGGGARLPADRRRPSARARRSPTTSPPSSASRRGRAAFGYKGTRPFVNLGRYKAVGKIGSLKFRGFLAWWMARTYHMSQIPGLARKVRAVVDWTVGLPFRRDIAEVGSIGHPRPLRDEVYARGGTHRPVD